MRARSKVIRPLLADSMLLDAGAIGLPAAFAPFMGSGQFGIYRALSSLAVPVRLVLLPIRPLIGRRDKRWHASWRALTLILLGAALMGGGALGALTILAASGALAGSTVHAAADQYSVPISINIAALFIGTYFYYVTRNYESGKSLWRLRVAQLTFSLLFQVIGFVAWGLSGAIWGSVAAAVLQSALLLAVCVVPRQPDSEAK